MTPTQQQDWMQRAIAGLSAVFPDVTKVENWAVCKQLVPHVQAIATRQAAIALETNEWAWLLDQTGYYLYNQGRYAEAEPLYQRALAISEQQLGPDHPDVATWLNNLAGLYYAQGRYAEAEPLYLRTLTICFNRLGADHPHTQTAWQNFYLFVQQVIRAGQTAQLSDHPVTQDLLRQMKQGEE